MAGSRTEALRTESGAVVEFAALHASPVFWGRGVPRGDGRTVVVVPGLFTNDVYLTPMREWLRRIGYRPARSTLAVNAGCPNRLLDTIERTVRREIDTTDHTVALIGHSRGGMLSWALAARLGHRVSHLALLGSPAPAVVAMLRERRTVSPAGIAPGALATAGQRALQLLDPDCALPTCGCAFMQDIVRPLATATKVLSIQSRDDPIVPAAAAEVPGGRNIVVSGSHGGLPGNRAVYGHVARFLADVGQ